MADAFGNIWPQYRRGWQQRYGAQSGPAGAQPFVGQPVTSADQPDSDELEMISSIPEYPATGQTPEAVTGVKPYVPQDYRLSGGAAASTWNPSPQVYDPNPYRTAVAAATARNPEAYTATVPPIKTGYGMPATEQGLSVTGLKPRLPQGYVSPTNLAAMDITSTHPAVAHAQAAVAHAQAAQRHVAVAQQHAAIAQQPATAQVNFQQPAQPGLAQRILQTLGHFFSGTLGQHSALRGQPVYQSTQPWTYGAPPSVPRAQPAYGGANLGFEIPGGENVLPDDWAGADIAGLNRPTGGGGWNLRGYSGGGGQTVREWLDAHPPPKGKGGSQNPQSGTNPALMGQPLGAGNQDPNRPQYEPSELSSQDLGRLASSGTPEHMYNMGPYNAGLTNVGGGGAAATGSEFSPAQSLVSSLTGAMSKGGGGGGGYGQAGFDASTMPDDWAGADVAGMGGGGAGGGMGLGSLAGAASGIISSFGDIVKKANAPVSVNPAEWANAPPPPATFSWPMLQPNYGGVMYT